MPIKEKEDFSKGIFQKVHIPKHDDMSEGDWEMSIKNLLTFLMEKRIFKGYKWEMENGRNKRIFIWIRKEDVPILREYFSRGGCLEMREGEVMQ